MINWLKPSRRLALERKSLGLVAVALTLVLALVATTCTPAPMGEKVVKVGIHGCFTGPGATVGVTATHGATDCCQYVTDNGGIGGAKVIGEWENVAMLIPKAILAHRRFLEKGCIAEWNIFGHIAEAMLPVWQKDEIPAAYAGSLTERMFGEREAWVFTGGPGTSPELAALSYAQ